MNTRHILAEKITKLIHGMYFGTEISDMDRVAIFVDGASVGATQAYSVLALAERFGQADLARVYVDANAPTDWLTAPGYRVVHTGPGRKRAEQLLAIDAIETALVSGYETFVIASSDGEFTHLAQRLREHGLKVVGMGAAIASLNFRASCSEFVPFIPANEASAPSAFIARPPA